MGTSVSVCSVFRRGSGAQVNHPGKGREKKNPCVGFFSSEVCSELGSEILPLSVPRRGVGKFCRLIGGEAIFFCFCTSSFPRTVCLGCLNVSARWELVWAEGAGTSLEPSAFAGRALTVSRLSSSIFHLPLEGEGKLEDVQCAVLKRLAGLLSSLFLGVSPQCEPLWCVSGGEDAGWLQFPLGLDALLADLSWKVIMQPLPTRPSLHILCSTSPCASTSVYS